MSTPNADELEARVRALNAEREQPTPRPLGVEELLGRLIAVLHLLYRTPPDKSAKDPATDRRLTA